jgi:hypothetical protein
MAIQMINIGSKENPVMVPESALSPQSAEGRDWWEDLAGGSVVLDEKSLNLLLEKTNEENQ